MYAYETSITVFPVSGIFIGIYFSFVMGEKQRKRRFLTIGDSLTAA